MPIVHHALNRFSWQQGVLTLLLVLSVFCARADIESKSALSREALLQNAVRTGQLDEVRMLIEDGASVNQGFPDGISLLHVAVINNQTDIIGLLLKSKANVHATDPATGATALHLAALYGRSEIAAELIRGGADVNALMKFNITPLLVAAQFNQAQMIELLLNHKANIKHVDQEGFSALHFAAQNGDDITAKILISKGADINLQDKTHRATPLKIARDQKHANMVQLLEEQGAK